MKRILISGLAVLLISGFYLSASQDQVLGKWEMTTQSPRGERTSEIEFYESDGQLMVKWEGRRGGEVNAAVTLKDQTIGWEVNRETPRGEMTMIYKGTVEGESMRGTIEISGRDMTMDWTANKLPKK